MTLTDRLLLVIPTAGRPLRQIRADFPDIAPGRLDTALVGLKASGAIRIILGMAAAVSAPRVEPPPRAETEADIKNREAVAAWRAANREKQRAYKRAYELRRKERNAKLPA